MQKLVQHVCELRYDDIPEPVVKGTKANLLDTIGCIVAGSSAPGCEEVRDLCVDLGGNPQAAGLVTGERLPVTLAALANGTMARARDMGNTHWGASVHPSEYVVPAALTMADCLGGVSGREFLLSQAVGEDILCRIGSALLEPCGLSGRYNLFRIFGPTIALARLRSLSEEQALMAMGLSYMQAGGEMQSYVDGALSIRVQQGLVCEAAVKSVLLAERGITGARGILDGKFGFYSAFEPKADTTELLTDLGTRFEGVNSSFKLHPCCHCAHAAIQATISLVTEFDLEPSSIDRIDVSLNRFDYDLVGQAVPNKLLPESVPDAQFSVYYTVAHAAIARRLFLDEFSVDALHDETARDLAQKVHAEVSPELGTGDDGRHPTRVVIHTTDGSVLERRLATAKGDPSDPPSEQDLLDKFRMACRFAAKPISRKAVDALADSIFNLEQVADMRELIAPLVPEGSLLGSGHADHA